MSESELRSLTTGDLRRLADELDSEHERRQRELRDSESDRERRELRESLARLEQRYAKLERLAIEQGFVLDGLEGDDAADDDADDDAGKPKAKPKAKGKPAARATRPGRKSGTAYQFTVDDAGRVVPLDVAEIYAGEDEPDEVELDDDGGDDDGD